MNFTTTDKANKYRIVSQIGDIISRRFGSEDPFFYYLPHILEELSLPDVAYKNFLSFVEYAVTYTPNPLISEALMLLNQMVDKEDGTPIEPSQSMFSGCRYYSWSELGNHIDFKSTVTHIVNKATMFSKIGRSSFQ